MTTTTTATTHGWGRPDLQAELDFVTRCVATRRYRAACADVIMAAMILVDRELTKAGIAGGLVLSGA